MTKQTYNLTEEPDTSVVSGIEVPDAASLGWSPVDHVYIHVDIHIDGEQAVSAFTAPDTHGADDAAKSSSVIEFTVTDLTADSLLADIGIQGLELFDLNDLLEPPDTVPELHMPLLAGGLDLDLDGAQIVSKAESSPPDAYHLPVNMALPQLAIVIDDEPGPDTVAI